VCVCVYVFWQICITHSRTLIKAVRL